MTSRLTKTSALRALKRVRRALGRRLRLYQYVRENWRELADAKAWNSPKHSVQQFHRLPTTYAPCPICGSKGLSHSAAYPSQLKPFRNWVVYFCADCGSGFVPDAAKLQGDYYKSEYSQSVATDRLAAPKKFFAAGGGAGASRQFARAKRQLDALRRAKANLDRVLDYGSGPGMFLHLARPKEAFAIEQDEAAHKHLNYLGATRLIDANLKSHRFDVIVASHVFEHLPAAEVLPKVRLLLSALAPEGRLLIEVPQGAHSYLRLDSRNDPHTIFYSAEGLEKLIERAGGQVLRGYTRVKRPSPLRKDPIYKPPSGKGFATLRGGGLTVIAAGPSE